MLVVLVFSVLLCATSSALRVEPVGCQPFPLCDPTSTAMLFASPPLFDVSFATSKGNFTMHVDTRWAPHGAQRFYNLARLGFYDNTRFFRVIDGFVNEFGLSGDPAISARYCNDVTCPAVAGAALASDTRPLTGAPSNTRGTVTYSLMDGGNGRLVNASTEIFINLVDNSRLDADGFLPFATISSNDMDSVVDSFYSGYGELDDPSICPNKHCRGPKLERIVAEGNQYLEEHFPKMDYVYHARVHQTI